MYISHKYKLLYLPVPKSGCTTTKRLLWYMDSGIKPPADGIHIAHVTQLFQKYGSIIKTLDKENYYKFCVIRDPVDRFISAYNHRVLVKGEIKDNSKVQNLPSLPNQPTFRQFLDNIKEYGSVVPVIKHHVDSLCEFLGEDPTIYDRIYKLSEINTELIPMLESKCGHSLELDMTINKSPHVIKREELPMNLIERIKNLYAKDYEVYGEYL